MHPLLLPVLLLTGPADATRAELELLRPDGKSFARRTLDALAGDEQVVIPDGGAAWQARFSQVDYDGRLEVCVDVLRWGTDGEQQDVTRACVVLHGRETPTATTFRSTDDVQIRLTVAR